MYCVCMGKCVCMLYATWYYMVWRIKGLTLPHLLEVKASFFPKFKKLKFVCLFTQWTYYIHLYSELLSHIIDYGTQKIIINVLE